jgi:hypothetical protein
MLLKINDGEKTNRRESFHSCALSQAALEDLANPPPLRLGKPVSPDTMAVEISSPNTLSPARRNAFAL